MIGVYICRVVIKNFRNFKSVDVRFNNKQIIFGENESGKTNFLYALQLILDPSLNEEERQLCHDDFFSELIDPEDNREIITIQVFIDGYQNSKTLLAQLSDATVKDGDHELLKITYTYFPEEKEDGTVEYVHHIFKGDDETNNFTSNDRKYIQLRVIKPLRDVELELRNSKSSPLQKLLKKYDFDEVLIRTIALEMSQSSQKILDLDEVTDMSKRLNNRLSQIVGLDSAFKIAFSMNDVDPLKIILSLRLLVADRQLENISLGLKNILYITLLLLLLDDETVPSIISQRAFTEYASCKGSEVILESYIKTEKGNYLIKDSADRIVLGDFFQKNSSAGRPTVLLAIEEPEAHLHPILQRLIYKDIIISNNNSVILTTHSAHIAAVTPLEYMVHLSKTRDKSTRINSYGNLELVDDDKNDIERYIDVKRGEIYFGKGILLVEGVAEEYLVRRFSDLLGINLDTYGIIICSIGSTNFIPYISYLEALGIPTAIITDGDFYYLNPDESKEYHCIENNAEKRISGYLGFKIGEKILIKKGFRVPKKMDPTAYQAMLMKHGIFVGKYTLEVDIMVSSKGYQLALDAIYKTYTDLTLGGSRKKANFRRELDSGEYFKCLAKIEENGIGKGRFAQRFSKECLRENIPVYIENAIKYMVDSTKR